MPRVVKRRVVKRTRRDQTPRECYFCQQQVDPDYKSIEGFTSLFLTPRGKILARRRSGVCARHQRKLARAVKRARLLALV